MNNHILRCITCKKEYEPEPGRYTCDDCGSSIAMCWVDIDTMSDDCKRCPVCGSEFSATTRNNFNEMLKFRLKETNQESDFYALSKKIQE